MQSISVLTVSFKLKVIEVIKNHWEHRTINLQMKQVSSKLSLFFSYHCYSSLSFLITKSDKYQLVVLNSALYFVMLLKMKVASAETCFQK